MIQLERKNINLIIDFDSTFIKDESLDIISNFSAVHTKNNSKIVDQISSITNDAMNGKINFSDALIKRIGLLNANKSHIDSTIEYIKKNITSSIIENKLTHVEFQDQLKQMQNILLLLHLQKIISQQPLALLRML